MSEASGGKRISKVASELGVGLAHIVEFLEKNGHEKVRPNSKIDEVTYQMLEKEFQSDKATKAKSVKLGENKVVRETISLDDKLKKTEEPRIEPTETDEIFIRNISEPKIEPAIAPPAPPAVEPAEEKIPEEKIEEKTPEPKEEVLEEKTETKAEEIKETVPKPEVESTKEAEVKSPESKGPKILATIDLKQFDTKSRKKSGKEEKAPEKEDVKEEAPNEEPKEIPKPIESKSTPTPPASPKAEEEQTKNTEHLATKFTKLSGPTVVGKIEIKPEPVKKKKQPVASSSPEKQPDKSKKKRKRINTPEGAEADKKKRFEKRTKGPVELKKELTPEEIQNQIKETLARLSGGTGKSKGAKHRKAKRDIYEQKAEDQRAAEEIEKTILKVTEFLTVSELSALMNVKPTEVIGACMSLGLFVSINQRLDSETIAIVAEEFGFTVSFTTDEIDETTLYEEENEERLEERPPVVTVMGHVDHGKTSLLDYVRKANVIAGEAGGITQHIGAYNVNVGNGKTITFLDTPGHEAFTAMRARGAQVTDIAIIVIAADDNVMPQTKEAINHAQAAGVPMVFALNKMDKEGANPDRIREELAQMNILVEDWGGKYQSQEISAKGGSNIDLLLEKVLLEAEILELKADSKIRARGTIIEASLDKGKGYVSTILVQSGTLKIGDVVLAGQQTGRVKAMFNERGNQIKTAGPSMPVTILGLSGAPSAGDKFVIMEDEREARNIANKRSQLQREQGVKTQKHITLDEIGRRIAVGDFKELNIIVKGDVDGSVEALSDSLLNLSQEKVAVNVIHKSVGQISETDVLLATASNAIIIGFQVRPSGSARKLAEKEEVEIRSYSIIYDAIEEVKLAMEGLLAPKVEEKIVCNIEVRETFKISKVGTIAGCYVLDGKVNRKTRIRLIRDGIVMFTGELGSLKRFKDDVKEVAAGYECGLNIHNYNDIKVGDIIEGFEEIEVKQKLN